MRALVERALSANYDLDQEIGRGGMGIVFRAKDRRLKRVVAIKVLPPELAFRGEIRQRFLREAETAAQLSHPNIVPIYSVDEREGLVFFVMACVEGPTLAKRLHDEGRIPVDDTRKILTEVSDALAYAHSRGVVHRDIKPDNILLDKDDGRAMVTDFGIARAIQEGADSQAHRDRRGDRHARVHESRTGGGRPRDRRAERPVRAGRGGISDARGAAAVPGIEHTVDVDEAHQRTSAAGGGMA